MSGGALACGRWAVASVDRVGGGLTAGRGSGFVAMLGLLMAFGPMSVDMYLPAMPRIASDLAVDQAGAQVTLSAFFLAFGLCQLVWGPLGDRYGRRGPIIVGTLLFILGSAGCALSPSILTLSLSRAVQGAGACCAPVLARAMVRDVFPRDQAASVLSMLMLVMGIAPMAAPLVGGQVLEHGSWRLIFAIQATFGLIAAGVTLAQAETLPDHQRSASRWLGQVRGYGTLMVSRRFLGYALSSACVYGGMFVYVSGTPFVYIEYFHVPAAYYGLLFALNIVGMIAVNMVNSRLVMRLGTDRMLAAGCLLIAVAGAALLAVGYTQAGGLVGILIALFCYMAFTGLIGANAVAGALAAYPHMAGTASALLGTSQWVLGAAAGTVLGTLADGTPWPMTALIGGLGIAGFVANRLLLRGPAA